MAEGHKDGCEEYVKADKVSTRQAAPVVAATVHHNNHAQFGNNFKVLPYIGFTTIMTEDENLEASASIGGKVESNINSRFSVGVGFGYTSLTTEDFGGDNYFGSNNGYGNGYGAFYGEQGREIQYSNLNFNLYTKFFVLDNDRFRPYVGAGIGYNRTTVKYSDNNSYGGNSGYGYGYGGYGYDNYSFGEEEVITSNINAELMLGSEIIFTEMIGMNVEFNYQRALGGNISTRNGIDNFQAPDQERLEDLSDEIGDANIISLFAGLLVQF